MKLFNQKYRLFTQKIKDVTNSIYELEFKIHKSRQLREESRLLRDRSIEQAAQVKARLAAPKDKEEQKSLEEELTVHEGNKEKYEGQMKLVDEQVNGTEEASGLIDTLRGLTELREMYRDYRSRI